MIKPTVPRLGGGETAGRTIWFTQATPLCDATVNLRNYEPLKISRSHVLTAGLIMAYMTDRPPTGSSTRTGSDFKVVADFNLGDQASVWEPMPAKRMIQPQSL